MLISPTEPPMLKKLGRSSPLPETHGVDILFASNGQWIGIQRKEMNDLIASVMDGRLQREVAMMQCRLAVAMVIIEGQPQWTTEGQYIDKGGYRQWTVAQHRGVLWSLRQKGIWVDATKSLADTCDTVEMFERWVGKSKHRGLEHRPGPVAMWGKVDNRDYACHLVMGLPGVGPELADRIVEEYGVPFRWKITVEDLEKVKGIGKVKARSIWEGLQDVMEEMEVE